MVGGWFSGSFFPRMSWVGGNGCLGWYYSFPKDGWKVVDSTAEECGEVSIEEGEGEGSSCCIACCCQFAKEQNERQNKNKAQSKSSCCKEQSKGRE
eukprot:4837810-Amphidinium_carterae.1